MRQPHGDYQRVRAYRAERSLWADARRVESETHTVKPTRRGMMIRYHRAYAPHPLRFETFEGAAAWAGTVTESAFWAARFPAVHVRFQRARGRSCWTRIVYAGSAERRDFLGRLVRTIALNEWGLSKPTILHELAHAAMPGNEGHGPQWVRAFVELVREYLGEEDALQLANAFLKNMVQIALRPEGWPSLEVSAAAAADERWTTPPADGDQLRLFAKEVER